MKQFSVYRHLSFVLCFCTFLTGLLSAHAAAPQATEKARENLLMLLSGEWVSRALYVVTKLEIADFLQKGPKTSQEIANFTGASSDSLQRVLHMLAGFGIFEEQDVGTFTNNEASALLSKSHPDSLYALSLFYGEDIHTALDQLLKSVNSGTPAFQHAFKQPVFAYFKEHPERAALFQEAMKEKSTAVVKSSLLAYNFGKFNTIYDIGGGYGHFMLALLSKYPHLNGMVFDVPEVIDAIPQKNGQILQTPSKLYAGDFFDAIPKGADAYLLKSVLHDWDDAKAEQILKNCYLAMDQSSRLLIVEVVLLPKDQSLYANCMDVLMLAITGGKERSLDSFSKMLDKAGFVIEHITPTSTEFSIIEAKKK